MNLSLLILCGLLILSCAFFVSAQNDSDTSNVFLDSDQDGMTDEEERLYGTNPHNSDTDGDGYSDGAEIKSGYDPLKMAPGDKLENSLDSAHMQAEVSFDQDNLTEKMAKEIANIATSENAEGQELTMEDIQSMIDSALNGEDAQVDLPEISKDDLNIKEQNYGNLSEEKVKVKMQEDFTDYLIGVYYILSSNSPEPITSAADISSLTGSLSMKVLSALSTRDTSSLDDLQKSGENILSQMYEMEVPEDLVELHIEALSLAQYAATIKDDVAPKSEDPLGEIISLSKVQNYLAILANFSSKIESKFLEYDLTYDEDMRKKIEGFGLIAPDYGDFSLENKE